MATKEETKPGRFSSLLSTTKDFAKVITFEAREGLSDGLIKAAEVIDTTDEQHTWKEAKKAEWEKKSLAAKAKPVTA